MSAVRRNSISEVTRRDIMDFLSVEQVPWAGRLDETGFLSRRCVTQQDKGAARIRIGCTGRSGR
jgi:hypothetical protein